jgi:signal transduction histidine kinase
LDPTKHWNRFRGVMGKRFSLPWRGLIPQLFVLIIFPLTILLLAFSFGSISMHQRAMRSLVGERDERAVRSAAAALATEIEHRMASLRTMALLAEESTPSSLAGLLDRSGDLPNGFEFGVALFDREGRILTATGEMEFWQSLASGALLPLDTNFPQEWGEISISPSLPNAIPGHKVSVITYSGRVAGVSGSEGMILAGAYSPEVLARSTLAQAFPADQIFVAVFEQNGELLYQNAASSPGESLLDHPGVNEALAGRSGTTYIDVGDEEHVVAYTPVPVVGWALIAEESWENVATPTLRTTQVAPLVLVPLLLIFLGALWFGVRQVIKPLQSLEAQANRVAWGDYQEIEKPVGGIAEIRNLQAELIHLTQKVRTAQQSLHNYIGAITAGQEEERRRLARELHDDTLQSLIALKQRVQLAHLNLGDQPPAENMLAELEALAEQTIDNLRRLTRALRPIYLEDLGLVAALEMLSIEASQAGGVSIHFQHQGAERRLPGDVELALYRIAQEALSNVARHSGSTQANIMIQYDPDGIRLSIIDNGRGFEMPKSPAEFAPAGHFGLLGLHERAELVGAKLQIRSAPGEGTQVIVRLPAGETDSERHEDRAKTEPGDGTH